MWVKNLAFATALAMCACAPHAPQLHGMQLEPAPQAADFTLTDQYGKPFTLSHTGGQAVALYFGFTHCADVCPRTLALLSNARAQAHLNVSQLRIVMITVDPHRDSRAALQRFFEKVGVQATGLTGSPAALRAVYRAYGIAVQPQKRDIAHTSTIFLIDSHGRLRETLVPEVSAKDIAADLRAVVD